MKSVLWLLVKHLFADAAYDRLKLMDKVAHLDFVVESSAEQHKRVTLLYVENRQFEAAIRALRVANSLATPLVIPAR